MIAHTVFDRTLLRAGQTVSMKHYLRTENLYSLSLADPKIAADAGRDHARRLGPEVRLRPRVARRALRRVPSFKLPDDAKLGVYQVRVEDDERQLRDRQLPRRGVPPAGDARPHRRALVGRRERSRSAAPRDFVRPASLSADVAIAYTNGGSAAALPVRCPPRSSPRVPQFAGYDGYTFGRAERARRRRTSPYADFVEDGPRFERGDAGPARRRRQARGHARQERRRPVELKDLPTIDAPRDLLVEATYPDPNGEVQTLSQTVSLWPAAVVVGVRADDWVSVRGKTQVKLLAVDTGGQAGRRRRRSNCPASRATCARSASAWSAASTRTTTSATSKTLGAAVQRQVERAGLRVLHGVARRAGQRRARRDGRRTRPATRPRRARRSGSRAQAEVWFGGENQDRVDVLPEKRSYAPGETAKFQVRMPFRVGHRAGRDRARRHPRDAGRRGPRRRPDDRDQGRARLGAERVRLGARGSRAHPRRAVVLVLHVGLEVADRVVARVARRRQAVRAADRDGRPRQARVQVRHRAIQVDRGAHQLKVAVTTDKPDYPVRAIAKATVRVTLPDGKPRRRPAPRSRSPPSTRRCSS